ncbi:outer membrane lipoprotein carrier protein [Solimonas aquatica]|uniref:Outer-membrane lipoprotein carrier protein n=1 Tax=Solimonas aquatica TaxID=489703 RepID=A0A1H9APF6_9GAMM|nr:outer membrane lipoprotein chaperone LolA [Solimonas aquatica]SEP78431.1 outer membrane lipoprotein carrier protein [Solimonas aquatica]
MKTLRLLCLPFLLLCWPPAWAGAGEDALKRFVDGVQTLSAAFEQVQIDEHGAVLSRRSGSFELSRPGRFRWSYESPYQQLMVCDGQRIWNYEPDLAQVTVRDAAQVLRGTPAALLAQKSLLGDAFAIESGGAKDGVDLVILKPRGDADFRKIELWLAAGVPQRMKFYDALGGYTDVRFSKVKTGVKLDAARFGFTPPKGTEVVDDGKAP